MRISFSLALLLSFGVIAILAALNISTGSIYSLAAETYYGSGIFLAGVLPITLFYLSLHERIREGIAVPSDAEIDSTYYLGFLITLITLIATVISSVYSMLQRPESAAPASDQSTLVLVSLSFALSLSATALALFFRINLASFKERVVLDLSVGGLEEHVSSMITQVDLSYSKLTATIGQALSELETLAQLQSSQFASELKTINDTIQQELRDFVKGFANDVASSGLSQSLSDVTESFRQGGRELSEIFTLLRPIPRRISTISSKLEEVATVTSSLHRSVSDVHASVRLSGTALDSIPIEAIRTAMEQLTRHLDALAAALQRSEVLARSGLSLSSDLFAKTTQQLNDASSVLGDAFTSLSGELSKAAALTSSELTDSLTDVSGAFAQGSRRVVEIFKALGEIPQLIGTISSKLDEVAGATSVMHQDVVDIHTKLGLTASALSSVHIESVPTAANQLTHHLDALADALQRSEGLMSSGISASSELLATTTRQLEEASSMLGNAFTVLAAELARTADLLAREINEK